MMKRIKREHVNLLFGAVIFICATYVSANHSIHLFHIGGYSGRMAIAGVVAGETLYAMGIINTVSSLMSKTAAPISARIATLIGTLMVGWANIYAGWEKWVTEKNPVGIIIGIAIMAYLWVADWIIVETLNGLLKKTSSDNQEKVDMSKVDVQKVDTYKVDMARVDTAEVDMSKVDMTKVDIQKVDKEEVDTSKVDMAGVDTAKLHASKVDTTKVDVSKVDVQTVDVDKVDTNKVDTVKVDTSKVDMKVDMEKVDTPKVDTTKVDVKKVDTKSKVVELSSRSNKEEEIKRVIEYALRIQEKEGELPGRKRLKKETGCTEYVAKKALEELKKTG